MSDDLAVEAGHQLAGGNGASSAPAPELAPPGADAEPEPVEELAAFEALEELAEGTDVEPTLTPTAANRNDEAGIAALPPMPVVPDSPPPELRYHRAFEVRTALRQLAQAWHIIWGLIVRQLRSQYSQQVLGIAWEVLGPLAQMVMFTLVLRSVGTRGSLRTGHVPTALYLYVGLVAWSFYSSAVSSGGSSLTGNPLLNKVYAPREVFPIAQVATSGIDAMISVLLFPVLCLIMRRMPSVETFYYAIPLILVLVVFALAVTLIVSATTVYARDLRSGLPLMMQVGMLMPGVIYSTSRLGALAHHPNALRIYTAVFPVSAVGDGLRNSVFFHLAPNWHMVGIASVSSCIYLVFGFLYFKRLETGFADVS